MDANSYGLLSGYQGTTPQRPMTEYERLLERMKASQRPEDAPEIAQTLSDRAGNDTAYGDMAIKAGLGPAVASIAHMAQPNNWLSMADDAGQYWGDKTLDATGSPAAATAVHTGMSIFGDPMDLLPALKVGGLAAVGAGALGYLMKQGGDPSNFRKMMPSNQLGIIGYHGSPHRINNVDAANPMGKFDLNKIGTGEGAQAYGHGVYLAQQKGVGGSYKLAGQTSAPTDVKTALWHIDNGVPPAPENTAGTMAAYKTLTDNPEFLDMAKAAKGDRVKTNEIIDMIAPTIENPGYLYEVDLPDEKIANMLDWDKPLSEQPEILAKLDKSQDFEVFKAKNGQTFLYLDGQELGTDRLTGAQLNEFVSQVTGSKPATSAKLNELGIPGIKYLDGTSRNAGEGTRNFVAFNPDDTKILSRNGLRATPPAQQQQARSGTAMSTALPIDEARGLLDAR
tara:strand:+ start:4051 stop:5403 length:1353 start_codon:yes stop_codon:yes gene_type:complete